MNFIRDRRRRERQPCLAHPRGADSNRPGFNDYVPSCLLPCPLPPPPLSPCLRFHRRRRLPFKYNRSTFTYFRGKRDKVGSGENQFLEKAAEERERGVAAIAAAASLLKFDRELGAIKISRINVGRDELLPS